MSQTLKNMSLKTIANIGFALGALGVLGTGKAQAQSQAERDHMMTLDTEFGAQAYNIPSLDVHAAFWTGRAQLTFLTDGNEPGIFPYAATSYRYTLARYQYKNTYSTPTAAGFNIGSGIYTSSITADGEAGVTGRLPVGPLTAFGDVYGQAPIFANGTSGLGAGVRAGIKMNVLRLSKKVALYLKASAEVGTQRTVTEELRQNADLTGEPIKFGDVPFKGFGKIGVAFGINLR